MTAPELLLYWLFYDNNKRSQNVADEKPVIRLFIIAFWLRFLFMAELIWAVVAIFHSEANTAESE